MLLKKGGLCQGGFCQGGACVRGGLYPFTKKVTRQEETQNSEFLLFFDKVLNATIVFQEVTEMTPFFVTDRILGR